MIIREMKMSSVLFMATVRVFDNVVESEVNKPDEKKNVLDGRWTERFHPQRFEIQKVFYFENITEL